MTTRFFVWLCLASASLATFALLAVVGNARCFSTPPCGG